MHRHPIDHENDHDLGEVIRIIAKARQSMPWPEKVPLPDGSVQCSGLSEAEINRHLAQVVIREMARMVVPDSVTERAAQAIYETENAAEAKTAQQLKPYRGRALMGFRSVLREFLREG